MSALSSRQILVGRFPAGMHGLDELFEEMYGQGGRPEEPGLALELVERARAHNYIPKGAVDDYAQALLREYSKYVTVRDSGSKPRPIQYGTWRGYPREQIPWFPTVASDLCDGCGACLKFCASRVLEPTEDGKVRVAEPFKCEVGCSSCERVCKPKAITFPPRAILDAFRPGGR